MLKDARELRRGDIIKLYGHRWVITHQYAIGGAGFKAVCQGKISEVFHHFKNVNEVEFIGNAFEI
jgi:hypothetical protein